ncbi:Trk system potassium transporter TrkA [Archaeoglobus sp.]
MRIVIAGAGEVGYNLAKVLCEHHDVYVIDTDEDKVENMKNLNVSAIRGNSASVDVLKSVEIEKADVFLAVTGNDEVNMLSGLLAKKFGAKKVVVRVSNPDYVDRPIVRDHMLGFDLVVCPQLALANEVANLLMIPGAVDFITLSGGEANVVEIKVGESIAGRKVSDLSLPKNVLIVAILRNGDIIIPRGDTTIRLGDVLVVLGKIDEIAKVQAFGQTLVKNVTIFGGGTVGEYIARTLETGKFRLTLVDSNMDRCEILSESLRKTKVFCGDATDVEFLEEIEVGKSDVVIATTESDERNLMISLLCKSMGAKKAIAKVEKGDYIKIFEMVGVDYAVSPRRVTFLEVMKYLRLVDIRSIAEIKQRIAVLEFIVKNIDKVKIADLKLPDCAIVGGVIREGDFLIPRGDTVIRKGDRVLVFATWDCIEDLEGIFE